MQLRSCIAVAVALIQPLAWKLPYAMGVALKRQKKKKKIQASKTEPGRNRKYEQRNHKY